MNKPKLFNTWTKERQEEWIVKKKKYQAEYRKKNHVKNYLKRRESILMKKRTERSRNKPVKPYNPIKYKDFDFSKIVLEERKNTFRNGQYDFAQYQREWRKNNKKQFLETRKKQNKQIREQKAAIKFFQMTQAVAEIANMNQKAI